MTVPRIIGHLLDLLEKTKELVTLTYDAVTMMNRLPRSTRWR